MNIDRMGLLLKSSVATGALTLELVAFDNSGDSSARIYVFLREVSC